MERQMLFAANTPVYDTSMHHTRRPAKSVPFLDFNDIVRLVDKIFVSSELTEGKLDAKAFLKYAATDGRISAWVDSHTDALKNLLDEPDELMNQPQGVLTGTGMMFSKLSLHKLLSFFRAESHANRLTKEDFERLCPILFGATKKECHKFASRLFGALDIDKNGKVDWLEFGTALGALCHGTQEERVEIAFGMADKNHDGLVSKKELISFMKMISTQGQGAYHDSVTGVREQRAPKPQYPTGPITMLPEPMQVRNEDSPHGVRGYVGDCKITVRLNDIVQSKKAPSGSGRESLMDQMLNPEVEAIFVSFRVHTMQPSRTRPDSNYV